MPSRRDSGDAKRFRLKEWRVRMSCKSESKSESKSKSKPMLLEDLEVEKQQNLKRFQEQQTSEINETRMKQTKNGIEEQVDCLTIIQNKSPEHM